MDSLSPHILMTASDPMQDLALQMLLKPYNLRLTFCPFDIDEIITRLQQREYDAVVIRCDEFDLPSVALLSHYNLQRSTHAGAFGRKPPVPFLAILPGANPARKEILLNSGFAAVLYLPFSEYMLATHLTEQIQRRKETLALRERMLYDRYSGLLLELRCPAHLHGFHYLCRCLVCLTDDPDALHQLTQVLYPRIAAQENTSAGNLERAMRTALDHIEAYGNRQLLDELLPGYLSRPHNRRRSFCVSELLAAILRRSHPAKEQSKSQIG